MKPVSFDSTDQRILDGAAAQMRRFGTKRMTIVSVAAELGMTHANVYRYFPSKLALQDAVTAQWLKPLEADLRVSADSPDPAYDKLERVLLVLHRSYRNKFADDPHIFDLFAEAVIEGRGVARKHRNAVQSTLQRIVEEGIAAGSFETSDHRRALALIFDAMHRFIHPVPVRMDADIPRAFLEQRFERLNTLVVRAIVTGRP